ncbi:vitelline membrane outer layer protein 1-like [Ruditapes philippinarum]|uniref:vitelline membrane outer layer protein 1-like n=1 Tax=Ruditapes philippinarum TaxID=129788 RepID=UPI00295BA75E|nr:vitelline membrane outer layer protein 1-like [Ruditapes philippinarum]
MAAVFNLIVFISCAVNAVGFLLVHENIQRNVTKILTVPNGGPWGTWTTKEFCAAGSYAIGYNMKIEKPQGAGDDTGLNALVLRCATKEGLFAGTVHSGEGPWGDWVAQDPKYCDSNQGLHHFMTGFSMYVEQDQGSGDDTIVDFVKFKCRDFEAATPEYDLAIAPGHGTWGSWGPSSASCGPNSAICGFMSKIEKPQGGADDTALNDLTMYCCT